MAVFTLARKLLEILGKGWDMRIIIYLFILTSGSLYAGEILKWVDEDGNVFYGDSPPLSVETERVRVLSAPSNPGKSLPRLSSQGSQSANNTNGTNVAGGSDQRGATKLPQDPAKIACDEATADLQVLKRSTRIILKSADGTSHYMTIEEINARREYSENAVKLHCQ